MNEFQARISRRNFLLKCGVGGVALAAGLHRKFLDGSSSPDTDKPASGNIRVGLDIGSSKVCAAVGELLPDKTIRILGFGQAPSRGVTAHRILDPKVAGACVRAALVDAEMRSNVVIRRVVLAVPGTIIGPFDSGTIWEQIFEWEEICYAARDDGSLYPVSLADCKRARGMSVVYGAHERIQHSIHCLQEIGVEVERAVFAPVASAAAMVSAVDKERGVLAIDLGEGTTDFAVYADGALVQADCLPIGGERIASEISLCLHIPPAQAKTLLTKEGSTWLGLSLNEEFERIVLPREPGFSGAEIEREMLNTIINERISSAFYRIKCLLESSGVRLDSLHGVRLGGGCRRLPGIEHLALEIFDLFPDSRFRMQRVEADNSILNNPRLACAVGLVKLAAPIGG